MPDRNQIGRLALLVLLTACGFTACAAPTPHPGKKLKLETITHDWQTTYVYREVDDPDAPKAKKR